MSVPRVSHFLLSDRKSKTQSQEDCNDINRETHAFKGSVNICLINDKLFADHQKLS